MGTAGDPVAFTDGLVGRGASRPIVPSGSWLEQVRDDDLRAVPAGGYRPGAQARSLATTRRLLDAAWCAMVQRPAEQLSFLESAIPLGLGLEHFERVD